MVSFDFDPADLVVEECRTVGVNGGGQVPEVVNRLTLRLDPARGAVPCTQLGVASELACDHRVGQCSGLIAQLVARGQRWNALRYLFARRLGIHGLRLLAHAGPAGTKDSSSRETCGQSARRRPCWPPAKRT